MVLDCAAGDCSNSTVYLCRRRSGDASVELAAAAAVRLANARLLASPGITGPVPDFVRRTRRARSRPQAPLAGPLQEDDSGGGGKIPPSHGRRLWFRINQRREGNIVSGWVRWDNQKLEPRRTRRSTKKSPDSDYSFVNLRVLCG